MKELKKVKKWRTMKMRVAEIGDNCIDVYERIGKNIQQGMLLIQV